MGGISPCLPSIKSFKQPRRAPLPLGHLYLSSQMEVDGRPPAAQGCSQGSTASAPAHAPSSPPGNHPSGCQPRAAPEPTTTPTVAWMQGKGPDMGPSSAPPWSGQGHFWQGRGRTEACHLAAGSPTPGNLIWPQRKRTHQYKVELGIDALCVLVRDAEAR